MTIMFATKSGSVNENKVNLKEKNYAQLQELWQRQNKILSNKRFVDSLPDKGDKIRNFCAQLKVELDKRRDYEKLCKDMSLLNVDKDQLDALEWTGKHGPYIKQTSSQLRINDDDEDVLKMLVSHSGVCQEKIIIKEKPEEPLIKPSDLTDEDSTVKDESKAEELNKFQDHVERYAKNLCGRIDTHSPGKSRLLLNKPAKPDKYSTAKITPVSLKESVTLQLYQEEKMKEIQAKRSKQKSVPLYSFNTNNYRDTSGFDALDFIEDVDSDDDDEDNVDV